MTGYICCSWHARPGRVFVQNKRGDGHYTKRKEKAPADQIIPCSVDGCNEPAVLLDHFWPYYWTKNRCEQHKEQSED